MVDGEGTRCVHGGEQPDPTTGALRTPVYRTSTFRFATTADLEAAARGERAGFYTRHGHPNFVAVERKFASLHGAEEAVLFGSGMAALAGILQGHLRAGDRIAAVADLYGGTRALLGDAARWGLTVAYIPSARLADGSAVDAALAGSRICIAESPTNPVLRVLDVRDLASRARAAGAIFVFDNTFATPVNQRPLDLGADLVWESATKALGGHSDLLGGLVAGRRALLEPVRRARQVYGAVSDPETAWLLERGMKTLAVRVERQNRTALEVAAWLEAHPAVRRVWHPGLPSHPDHAIARATMRGAGGMVTFACRGGGEAARRVADRVRLIANAPSLGGAESLLSLPVLTSHAYLTPAEREAVGVTEDLVRLSIGLEDAADLRADLAQALGSG